MKTIKNKIVIIIILVLSVNSSNSQVFEWAKSNISLGDYGSGNRIAADASNNTIALLGQVIVKYNSSGVIVWNKNVPTSLIGSGDLICEDIVSDNSGNLYITGNLSGTGTFFFGASSTLPITPAPGNNTFVAKYNSSGICQWVKNWLSGNHGRIYIETDNSNNCYIACSFQGSVTLPGISLPLTSSGLTDVFLAKFSTINGTCMWAVRGGSSVGWELCYGLTVDKINNKVFVSSAIEHPAYAVPSVTFNSYSSGSTFTINNTYGTSPLKTGFFITYGINGIVITGKEFELKYSWGYFGRNNLGIDGSGNLYVDGGNSVLKYGTSLIPTLHISIPDVLNVVKMTTQSDGSNYLMCSIEEEDSGEVAATGPIYLPPHNIVSTGANREVFILKYDLFGNISWVTTAGTNAGSSNIIYSTDMCIQGGFPYFIGFYSGSVNFGSILLNSVTPNTYVAKIIPNANTITGIVFPDHFICDGIHQSTEPVFKGVVVSQSPSGEVSASGLTGEYFSHCLTGTTTLSILSPPKHYNSPAPITLGFGSLNNIVSGQNFALCPISNIDDLSITIDEVARPRPGEQTTQKIKYKNAGTNTIQPSTITLEFDDSKLLFFSGTPSNPSLIMSGTGPNRTWTFPALTSLLPNEEGSIEIEYTVTGSLNDLLATKVNIYPLTGDVDPGDNADTLNQTIRGSWDPNDKSVSPSGDLTSLDIQNESPLTYTIRFQNTGTDYARNVVITDTIINKLNIASIEAVSASHDYQFSILEGKVLVWTFKNIFLPDKTTDEPGSHGFVKFKIKPRSSLVIGEEITNSANIYFDFNDPVITNTTVNLISGPPKFIDLKFRLEAMFPNLDTVRVYLVRSLAPFQKIDSSIVYSELDGTKFKALPSFKKGVLGSSYFIVVKHRNSIETWSRTPVTFNSNTISYDFTTSADMAFGNNMKQVGTSPVCFAFYSGDVNQDGAVDLSDMTPIDNDSYNYVTGYVNSDLNGDNFVDLNDMTFADNNSYNFVVKMRP